MKRLSKAFFLGSYIGAGIALFIYTEIAFMDFFKYTDFGGLLPGFTYMDGVEIPLWHYTLSGDLSSWIGIFFIVVLCIFVYKAWESIQDGHARTSAGKALGFLFIPFFNLYWIFQAVWGFAVDFNKYISRNNVNTAPRLPQRLFLALCILTLLGFILGWVGDIPRFNLYVNYGTWVVVMAYYVIGAILINKVCNAVNALPLPVKKLDSGVARQNY